jgi:cytochrome c oxidase subunit 4
VQVLSSDRSESSRKYIIVWLALICLTATTVWVYFLHIGHAGSIIALTIASIKAGLILFFFMQLRYAGRFIQTIFLIPLALVGVIIAVTFLDVLLR